MKKKTALILAAVLFFIQALGALWMGCFNSHGFVVYKYQEKNTGKTAIVKTTFRKDEYDWGVLEDLKTDKAVAAVVSNPSRIDLKYDDRNYLRLEKSSDRKLYLKGEIPTPMGTLHVANEVEKGKPLHRMFDATVAHWRVRKLLPIPVLI
jgi:hypothetical protein